MKKLLEQRARVFEQARTILRKAEEEGRALTSEERTEYDARMADVTTLGETIERSRQSAELSAGLDQSLGVVNRGTERRGSDIADSAVDSFLRGGIADLSTEQRDMFGVRGDGRGTDQINIRAASPLSVTTGAGGETIPTGFVYTLEQALKWFGGMRQSRATVLRTATGNSLPYPTLNDTGNVGAILAESVAATQATTEMSTSSVTFGAFKYTSKLVLVSIELLQDSAFDVQAFVAANLGTRLGRIQNTHFTTGSGSGQPKGVITAGTSALTSASATAVTLDEILTLIHDVDPAYRIAGEFMFNDSTALMLEKLKDNNGRPLLNAILSGISGDLKAGQPGAAGRYSLYGYSVVINNDLDSIAATKKPIAFGDFSKYIIRDVLDLMLVRFGETYMLNGQIGFVAFMRSDANLIDAGTHPVQFITCHA